MYDKQHVEMYDKQKRYENYALESVSRAKNRILRLCRPESAWSWFKNEQDIYQAADNIACIITVSTLEVVKVSDGCAGLKRG